MIYPESSVPELMRKTHQPITISSDAFIVNPTPKKSLFNKMIDVFGSKLNTPPVIIGVKTNGGKKISVE